MRVETVQHIHPPPAQTVTVKQMGNITEVRYCTVGRGCPIMKLDKDTYINLAAGTGEVLEFQHHEKRTDDFASLSQSLVRLRDLINTNVTDAQNCKWLTLTYAENMTDTIRLYEDFKQFNKRLRYWLNTNDKPRHEYIAVAEPQLRGAWHFHCFLIFPTAAPFIHYDTIKKAWGQGAINVKALDNINNVGAYLSPYLTDLSLPDALADGFHGVNTKKGLRVVDDTDSAGNKASKGYVKGARLALYPAGFRLYRASRGIKRPTVFECSEEEAMQLVGAAPLTYEKTIRLCDEADGNTINVINYRQYNAVAKRRGSEPLE